MRDSTVYLFHTWYVVFFCFFYQAATAIPKINCILFETVVQVNLRLTTSQVEEKKKRKMYYYAI